MQELQQQHKYSGKKQQLVVKLLLLQQEHLQQQTKCNDYISSKNEILDKKNQHFFAHLHSIFFLTIL